MAHHMWHDMPYFACCVIEDATEENAYAVKQLCDRIIATDALKAHKIYWLSISDHPADAMSKFPDAGIRFSAQHSASFTSPDEILSALEKLT